VRSFAPVHSLPWYLDLLQAQSSKVKWPWTKPLKLSAKTYLSSFSVVYLRCFITATESWQTHLSKCYWWFIFSWLFPFYFFSFFA
jgi:hypothetical protein